MYIFKAIVDVCFMRIYIKLISIDFKQSIEMTYQKDSSISSCTLHSALCTLVMLNTYTSSSISTIYIANPCLFVCLCVCLCCGCRVPSGEILESVVSDNNLTEAVAVGYLSQLLQAVDTLHRIKIAHLDIRVSYHTSQPHPLFLIHIFVPVLCYAHT